jgi:hypothetical protein
MSSIAPPPEGSDPQNAPPEGYPQYPQTPPSPPPAAPPYAPSGSYPGASGYTGQAGQPGYGYPAPYPYSGTPVAAAPTDDKAVWALVAAIVGFVLCPVVLHIVGWVLANQSLATIRASGGTIGGEGIAKAARIVSIVGLVVSGVAVLLAILFLLIGVATLGQTGLETGLST